MAEKKKTESGTQKKRALGRGLEALMNSGESSSARNQFESQLYPKDSSDRIISIATNRIHPNPNQPRKRFEEESLQGLALSIKSQGLLQPLIVKKAADGFELIAGERRLRAAKLAGLKDVPCIVKDIDEKQRLATSLIENLQREDLNPIELARGIREMQQMFELTQQEIATELGLSRPNIANTLRLLDLTFEVQEMVANGKLSAGSARALVILPIDIQTHIAERIADDGLSTRQAEILVKEIVESLVRKANATKDDDNTTSGTEFPTDVAANTSNIMLKTIANELTRHYGTRVDIRPLKEGGVISFRYFDESDLNRLLSLFGAEENPI